MHCSLATSYPLICAPAAHELDVVFFGPGVGECVLMHLGNGEWFVIDSCIFPGRTRPIAVEYLEAINIDPSAAIKRVLATHWHDDHIRGISQIVRECSNAKFAMSAALNCEQFYQLTLRVKAQNTLIEASSSADEFASILEEILSRGIASPDFYAADGQILFQGGLAGSAEVRALSPSSAAVTNSATQMMSQFFADGAKRFKKLSPNHLSVAVQVKVGKIAMLMGADLETNSEAHYGWNAVLSSDVRPLDRCGVFKVPHHGSENAHHDEVWNQMLSVSPLAIVTPYAKLRDPLPTIGNVNRIVARTDEAYVTTWPPSQKPLRRPGVDRQMNNATRTRRTLNRTPGFVQLRLDLSDENAVPQIQLHGSAKKLKS